MRDRPFLESRVSRAFKKVKRGGFTRSCDYDVQVFVHLDGMKLSNFKYMCIKRDELSKSIFGRETKSL
jgi:hypothetical protein